MAPISSTSLFYVRIYYNKTNITLYAYDGTTLGSAIIPINTYFGKHIYIDATASKDKRTLRVSLDGETWVESTNTLAITDWNGGDLAYYIGHYPGATLTIPNSIDLNRIQIYVNDVLKYQPCIIFPYKQSKGGDKIVDVAYRNLVQDVYNRDNYAGYYTIDTVNNNITLPMGDIYGMLNKVSISDYYKPPLFSMMNSLIKLNDLQWLRADTFSWQDGTLYERAYNKLVEEFDAIPRNTFYRWDGDNGVTYYLRKNTGVVTGDIVYTGTPNLNLHNVGTVTVLDSVVKYGNVTLTLITTAGSTVVSLSYGVEGGVAYTRSANDYRICEPSQEDNVLNKYNTQGIAMYFILDKANKRFKLPRTKYGFNGVRAYVGNDIGESLPNIKGVKPDWIGNAGYSGAFYATTTTSHGTANSPLTNPSTIATGFNASRSSSTYKDGAPVQERATQVYLYFFVGEYKEEAVRNTAGLNAELFNSKVDLNFSNMNPSQAARKSIIKWIMPNYSAGVTYANDTTVHIAPSEGILIISYYISAHATGYLKINGTNAAANFHSSDYGTYITGEYLLSQGDTFQITSVALNDTQIPFIYRFYPCKGIS